MINRTKHIPAEFVLDTPEILSLRSTVAVDPDQQPALDAAIAARQEIVLDAITDRILTNVQVLDDLLFDPKVEAACDELQRCLDFTLAHFSITKHPTSKRDVPLGMLMAHAYRRRGPLVQVARALIGLVPTKQILQYGHDLQVVKSARAARRGDSNA